MSKQEIVKYDIRMSNYVAMPRIAKDELNPYEFKLYACYIDESRWTNRAVEIGGRHGASLCGMGRNTFYKARQGLHDKGYIILTEAQNPDEADVVEIVADVWKRNEEKYGSPEASIRQTVEEILGGRYSDEQLKTILSALVQKGVAEDTGEDGGGFNQSQPGFDQSRRRLQLKPDSNINKSEEEKDSLSPGVPPTDEDEASPDFDASETYVPPGMREVFESKGHLQDEDPADISDRALTVWLMKELDTKKLGAKAIKNLRNKIIRKDGEGSHTHPSPVDLYDRDESYREFCADRLARFKAMNDGVVSANNFALSIRKMFNPEHETNKQKWPGYLQWKRVNVVEAAPKQVLNPDGTPIKEVRWEDIPPAPDEPWLHIGV